MKTGRRQRTSLTHFILIFLAAFILCAANAFAGPGKTTYQAKIVKPDGYPLESSSVNFKFSILEPAGSCVLYSETYSSVNMNTTGGLISFSLGSGLKTYPASSTTFENVFSNITPNMACDAAGVPSVYTPGANDSRKVIMQFNDGGGWQTLPAMTINAVPYAMYANDTLKFNGLAPSDFVQMTMMPTCTASEALRYNGASFYCVAVGGSGSVTSSTVISALGYTPANPSTLSTSFTTTASFATVTSTLTSLGNSVTAISSQLDTTATSATVLTMAMNAMTTSVSNLITSMSAVTSSQWTSSGTSVYYNGGSVLVNSVNPLGRLTVGDGTANSETITLNALNFAWYGWYLGGVRTAFIQSTSTEYAIYSQTLGVPMTFSTSSNERMRISASGSVGIASATPGSRLVVKGAGTTSGTSVLTLTNSSNTPLMVVRDDGNVGIASSTPGTKFTVNANVSIGENNTIDASNVSNKASQFGNNNSYASGGGGSNEAYSFGSYNTIDNQGNGARSSFLFGSRNVANDSVVILGYGVSNTAANSVAIGYNAATLNVSSNGLVGLGTSAPSTALHILNGDPDISMDFSASPTATAAELKFKNNGVEQGSLAYDRSNNSIRILYDRQNASSGTFSIRKYSTDVVTVLNNGNTGIGTSAPVTRLDVSGGVRISMESATCAASYAGTLRYNAGAVEYCNGTSWSAFGVSGAGLQSFNGSVSGTQSFAVGTTGTSLNIATANGVHTINIPLASAGSVTGGLLSNADYTTFMNKVSTASFTALSSTTTNLSSSMTTLAASVGAIVSSQWITSGTTIRYTNGNVGIGAGVTNPAYDLDIIASATNPAAINLTASGNMGKTSTIYLTSTAVSANSYIRQDSFGSYSAGTGSSGWGMNFISGRPNYSSFYFRDSNDNVGVAIVNDYAKVTSMPFTAHLLVGGNVGIGKVNPVTRLEVSGGVKISMESATCAVSYAGTLRYNVGVVEYCDGASWTTLASGTGSQWSTSGSTINFNSGYVGIGTSTPTSRLEIVGGNGSSGLLKLTTTGDVSSSGSTFLRFNDVNGNAGWVGFGGTSDQFSITSYKPGAMTFATNNTEAMRVTSSGALGVGTTAPASKLHVAADGTYQFHISGLTNQNKRLRLGYDTTSNYGQIQALTYGSTYDTLSLNPAGGNVGIGTASASARLEVTSPNDTSIALYVGNSASSGVTGLYFSRWGSASAPMGIQGTISGVGANPIALQAQAGNVGIGTTTPTEKLTLNDGNFYIPYTANKTHGFKLDVGNDLAYLWRNYAYADDSFFISQNWYANDAGTEVIPNAGHSTAAIEMRRQVGINFKTGPTASTPVTRMNIDINGNVGIGTNAPGARLHIITPTSGSVNNRFVTGNSNSDLVNASGLSGEVLLDHFVGARFYATSPTSLTRVATFKIDNAPTLSGTITASETLALYVEAGNSAFVGPLGVGTSNLMPNTKLHVYRGPASAATYVATNSTALIEDDDYALLDLAVKNNGLAGVRFDTGSDTTGSIFYYGPSNATGERMAFLTSGTEKVTITPSGYLGVGVSNPTSKLSNIPAGAVNANIGNEGGTGESANSFNWGTAAAGYAAAISNNSSGAGANGLQVRTLANTSNQIVFTAGVGVSSSANTKDYFTVRSDGRVGVNTTSPVNNFTVNGMMALQTNATQDHVYMEFYARSATPTTRSGWLGYPGAASTLLSVTNEISGGHVNLATVGTGKVGINQAAPSYMLDVNGTIRGYGITDSSDIRLKNTIEPLDFSLQKILKVQGVSYYWNDKKFSEKKQIGFIAQQLEKIFPELVETDNQGMKSVNYSHLVSPLVEAVKSLYAKITAVEAKQETQARELASVKAENAEIKAENEKLKDRLDRLEKMMTEKKK